MLELINNKTTYFIAVDMQNPRGQRMINIPIRRFSSREEAQEALPEVQAEFPLAYIFRSEPEEADFYPSTKGNDND